MYKRQIYQIAESNRIESKLFRPNWNVLVCAFFLSALGVGEIVTFGELHFEQMCVMSIVVNFWLSVAACLHLAFDHIG